MLGVENDVLLRLTVGELIHGPSRVISAERITWNGAGRVSAGTGERRDRQVNIHTDEAYATGHGLPGAIAEGMHSTNWLSAMLAARFGPHYFARGSLSTRYRRPVVVSDVLTPCAAVAEKVELEDGQVRYELEVWCTNGQGVRVTEGHASVLIDPGDSESAFVPAATHLEEVA